MSNRLSPFGQYRATYPVQAFPRVFPDVEREVRAAYAERPGVTIRVAKGKKAWTITAYRGWTAGFRIDFTPGPGAFGPTDVIVELYRWSRVSGLALYLAAAASFGFLGLSWMANWVGFANAEPLVVTWEAVLIGVAAACLGGAVSGLLMYAGGGRLRDDELVAVGELVGKVMEKQAQTTPPDLRT